MVVVYSADAAREFPYRDEHLLFDCACHVLLAVVSDLVRIQPVAAIVRAGCVNGKVWY